MSECNDKQSTMVVIDGGKEDRGRESVPYPILSIEKEEIELESFILSGITTEGKRCVLTSNCSLDELASYSMILNTIIQEKIRNSLL